MTIESLRANKTADYLGDSVYACRDPHIGDLVLCTCNGDSVRNEIVLEPQVLRALIGYIKRHNMEPPE